jgi:hypothetical protein
MTDAERYRLIHARFAAMTPAQQQDFLGLLGIDYSIVAPLSEAIDADMDHLLRASVPERHKGCASPVGSVQNYISELEQALQNATGELL